MVSDGEQIYRTYCVACHQNDGKGDGSRFPPLDSSEYVLGDKQRLINILLNGLQETITVKDKQYNDLMPAHNFLSDDDLALVLTFIRQNFSNNASEITSDEIAKERNAKNARK